MNTQLLYQPALSQIFLCHCGSSSHKFDYFLPKNQGREATRFAPFKAYICALPLACGVS
jgi:hypothetical protein